METFQCAQKLSQPALLEVKQEPTELSPTEVENNADTGEEHVSACEQSKQQETHPASQAIAQISTSSDTSPVFSHGNSNIFQQNHQVSPQHPPAINVAQVQFTNFPDKTNFLPGPSQYSVVHPPVAHQHHISRNVPRLSEYNDIDLHNQVSLSGNVNAPNADSCTVNNQPLNLVSSGSNNSSNNSNRRQSEVQGDGDTCSSGGSNVANKQSRSRYGILPESENLVLLLEARDQQNTDSSSSPVETSSSVQDGSSSRNYQEDRRTLGTKGEKGGQRVNDGSSPWNGRLLPVSLLSDAGRDSGERLENRNSVDCWKNDFYTYYRQHTEYGGR